MILCRSGIVDCAGGGGRSLLCSLCSCGGDGGLGGTDHSEAIHAASAGVGCLSSLPLYVQNDRQFQTEGVEFWFQHVRLITALPMLNIVITPLTAIMTALLYLKTRQASGESLRDAVERLEGLEISRSRWPARMQTRSGSSTANSSTPLN